MSFVATEIQEEIRASARAVLADRVPAPLAQGGSKRVESESLWTTTAPLGWAGIAVPERFGGAGLGLDDAVALVDELGRGLCSGPYVDSVLLATMLVDADRDQDSADRLVDLATGQLRVAFGPFTGPRLVARAAATTESSATYVLDGTIAFIPEAASSDLFVVPAVLGGRPVVAMVPASSAGLQTEIMDTLDLTRTYSRVAFNQTPLPAPAIIDSAATHRRIMNLQRILACAETAGAAAALLDATVSYAKERVQFDRPIAQFQAVKHRCADMRIALDAMRAITEAAVQKLGTGAGAELATLSACAVVGEKAPWLAGEALQIHGGIGMTWEHPLHLYIRRIRTNSMLHCNVADACGAIAKEVL